MRKTVAQGYGFCLKLGYPKNHVVYHQYPHQNFPFGVQVYSYPAITLMLLITLHMMFQILYYIHIRIIRPQQITSHHIISFYIFYLILQHIISSHHISHSHYNPTLCFSEKKQTETPVFRWFLGAELKLRQPIGPEFLAQMVTISPAFSDRHEAGHGLNISENRLYSQ